VAASKASDQPEPIVATRMPPAAAPKICVPLRERRSSAFASWSRRDDSLGRREEERGRRTAYQLERDQVPDLGSPGEHERRDCRLGRAGDRIGYDHDVVAREPIRPDPSHEDEDDLRQCARADDEPEIRRGAADVQHGEGKRDRRESGPEEGHGPPEEQQPEVPLDERAEGSAQHRHLRCQIREDAGRIDLAAECEEVERPRFWACEAGNPWLVLHLRPPR
jgi:hypothetical protein